MPAKNPRVNLTLPPDLYAVLRDLSRLTGQGMAGIVTDLLRQQQPVLHQTVQIIEKAREGAPLPLSVRLELNASEHRALNLAEEALTALDRAQEAVERPEGKDLYARVRNRRVTGGGAAARASRPLAINKGARIVPTDPQGDGPEGDE